MLPALAFLSALTSLSQPPVADPPPTRVAVLEVGDRTKPHDHDDQLVLGFHLFAADFRGVIPLLEADRPDVVVIHQHSGFGLVPVAADIADVLHEEFRPKFRTVGWGSSLLGAGGIAVWGLPDLYAHQAAEAGGFTLGMGTMRSWGRGDLDPLYDRLQGVLCRGGRPPELAAALSSTSPLSVLVDERGRATSWRRYGGGPVVVNPEDRVLVLKAPQAATLGAISGLAETRDELAAAIGFKSVVWVGEPASRALALTFSQRRDLLRQIERDTKDFDKLEGLAAGTIKGPGRAEHLRSAGVIAQRLHDVFWRDPVIHRAWFRHFRPVNRDRFEHEINLWKERVAKLEATPGVRPAPAPRTAPPRSVPAPITPGSEPRAPTRIAILDLGDPAPTLHGAEQIILGVHLSAADILAAIPLLERDSVDLVVLRVSAPELPSFDLAATLKDAPIPPKFRVAAWLDRPGPGGLKTVWGIRDLVCTSTSRLGFFYRGPGCVRDPDEAARFEEAMERTGRGGGRPSALTRGMLHTNGLSWDRAPVGTIVIRDDARGEHSLAGVDTTPVLSPADAEVIGLVRGIADDRDAVARKLGVVNIAWCGEKARDLIKSRVSRARSDQVRLSRAATDYLGHLQQAESAPPAARARYVKDARQRLSIIREVTSRSDGLTLAVMGMLPKQCADWIREQETKLDRLGSASPMPARAPP